MGTRADKLRAELLAWTKKWRHETCSRLGDCEPREGTHDDQCEIRRNESEGIELVNALEIAEHEENDTSELNGHIEIAAQCRDWIAAERDLGAANLIGPDGGRLNDFVESLGVVIGAAVGAWGIATCELDRLRALLVRACDNLETEGLDDCASEIRKAAGL